MAISRSGKMRLYAFKSVLACLIDVFSRYRNIGDAAPRQKALKLSLALTFGQIFEEFLSKRQVKPKTGYDYRNTIELHCADWIPLPIRDIDEQAVENKYHQVLKAVVAKTATNTKPSNGIGQAGKLIRYVRAIFNYAKTKRIGKERLIRDNPCDVIKELKLKTICAPRTRILLPSEARELFEELDRQQWLEEWAKANIKKGQSYIAMRALIKAEHNKEYIISTVRDYVTLLLFTGMRKEEAFSLEWSDVDFANGFFTAKGTKNHSDFSIPMTDTLRIILEARKKEVGATSRWVFPAPRQPAKHMTEPHFQLNALGRELGFKFTSHDLRRTFASYAHEYGLDERSIKRALNHKVQSVTSNYIIASLNSIRPYFEKVEEQIRAYAFDAPMLSKMTEAERKQMEQDETDFAEMVSKDIAARAKGKRKKVSTH